MLENCTEESIQPCSIDVRLGKIFKVVGTGVLDYEHMPDVSEIKLPYVLKPNEFILATSIEKMNQTKTEHAALFFPRSRAERLGLLIQSGVIHPFYKGEFVFAIKNIANHKIKLSHGMGVAQLCFFDVKSNCIPLTHLYQHGKVI